MAPKIDPREISDSNHYDYKVAYKVSGLIGEAISGVIRKSATPTTRYVGVTEFKQKYNIKEDIDTQRKLMNVIKALQAVPIESGYDTRPAVEALHKFHTEWRQKYELEAKTLQEQQAQEKESATPYAALRKELEDSPLQNPPKSVRKPGTPVGQKVDAPKIAREARLKSLTQAFLKPLSPKEQGELNSFLMKNLGFNIHKDSLFGINSEYDITLAKIRSDTEAILDLAKRNLGDPEQGIRPTHRTFLLSNIKTIQDLLNESKPRESGRQLFQGQESTPTKQPQIEQEEEVEIVTPTKQQQERQQNVSLRTAEKLRQIQPIPNFPAQVEFQNILLMPSGEREVKLETQKEQTEYFNTSQNLLAIKGSDDFIDKFYQVYTYSDNGILKYKPGRVADGDVILRYLKTIELRLSEWFEDYYQQFIDEFFKQAGFPMDVISKHYKFELFFRLVLQTKGGFTDAKKIAREYREYQFAMKRGEKVLAPVSFNPLMDYLKRGGFRVFVEDVIMRVSTNIAFVIEFYMDNANRIFDVLPAGSNARKYQIIVEY